MKNLPKTAAKIVSYVTPARLEKWRAAAKDLLATYFFVMSPHYRHVAWCSHCHHFIWLNTSRHRKETTCPHCGSVGEQIHGWRGYSRLHDRILSYHYTYSRKAGGALVAVGIYTEVWWHRRDSETGKLIMPWCIEPDAALDSVSVFCYGEGGIMACPSRGRWAAAGRRLDKVGHPRTRAGTYDNMGMSALRMIYADEDELNRAVKKTPIHYIWDALSVSSRTIAVQRDSALQLLEKAARYPFAVECLAKMGYPLQCALLENVYSTIQWDKRKRGIIDWKGKTLRDVLRAALTKEEKEWLRQEKKTKMYIRTLGAWQSLRAEGIQQTILPDIVVTGYGAWMREILPDVSPIRIMHYAKKQGCSCQHYMDYIGMCQRMGVNLAEKANLFPRDVYRAHDAMVEHIRARRELERQRKREEAAAGYNAVWEKRRKNIVRRYAFTAGGVTIRVPERMEELIDEGNAMHNCVGTYIKRVASGNTIVVFIREEETNERLGTMEISADGTRIVQARAAFNAKLPQDVQAFVDKFEAEKIKPIGMTG